jgi:hypothetical protein
VSVACAGFEGRSCLPITIPGSAGRARATTYDSEILTGASFAADGRGLHTAATGNDCKVSTSLSRTSNPGAYFPGITPTITEVLPRPTLRRFPALVALALLLAAPRTGEISAGRGFAAQIEALSEPGGYFDTDNLISNERSYLQVFSEIDREGVKGGAYVGVGPDQNFSYIAHIRPSIAFIVDIRRDNLLLHLLFKALFQQARTRLEYLALLFGRPVPRDQDNWRGESIARLAAYIDAHPPDRQAIVALRARTDAVITRFGVRLSKADLATIDRFHRTFINAGLEMRFESAGRPPQTHYPTYRDLLLAADSLGQEGNYLATEDAFDFVKTLQHRNLVIPVVGNLAGPKALIAIGDVLTRRGEPLSAFYTSNVEFYLARSGTLDRFFGNLAHIPHAPHAVVIRSIFGRFNGGSTSTTESIDDLVAAGRH